LKKLFPLLTLLILTGYIKAQTMPFGQIDMADLKMTSCDFEKDANAMVLFDRAAVSYKSSSIIMERHKRIKIFNDNGKNEANIRIEYYIGEFDESISDVEAETINLNGTSIEYAAVDKKLIYMEAIDKNKKAVVFTFPNVKPGSIVEFKYKLTTAQPYNYPDWFFQSDLPTRYSELDAGFNDDYVMTFNNRTFQPVVKDTAILKTRHTEGGRHIWALANIKSYKSEPLTDFPEDYLQCVLFKVFHVNRPWRVVGEAMLADKDFGLQLSKKLSNEDAIIANANLLKTDDEKIAYIYNTVKAAMKWNKVNLWHTVDGIKNAWDKKTGNSTEINLILYHLLKAAKINTILLALSTRDNGKFDAEYPSAMHLNKTVVYFPVDNANYYIMDASDPYNSYIDIPVELGGLQVLSLDPDGGRITIMPIKRGQAKEFTLINGGITAGGELEGNADISSSGYFREKYLRQIDGLGEKKFAVEILSDNKDLKITAIKFENQQIDTLPLGQNFEFKYALTAPDGDYMYFNPNDLNRLGPNPFLSETRVSNIDFGCLNYYSINGQYKIPPGYKTGNLPESVSMAMPDKSISFKRMIAEQDGVIIARYTIDFKRAVFSKTEYPAIRDFYKKMYELLNEQIVLKKL